MRILTPFLVPKKEPLWLAPPLELFDNLYNGKYRMAGPTRKGITQQIRQGVVEIQSRYMADSSLLKEAGSRV